MGCLPPVGQNPPKCNRGGRWPWFVHPGVRLSSTVPARQAGAGMACWTGAANARGGSLHTSLRGQRCTPGVGGHGRNAARRSTAPRAAPENRQNSHRPPRRARGIHGPRLTAVRTPPEFACATPRQGPWPELLIASKPPAPWEFDRCHSHSPHGPVLRTLFNASTRGGGN